MSFFFFNIFQEAGRQFDYIFGDLPDVPVSTSSRDNDIWDFLKGIISSGVSLLKVNTGNIIGGPDIGVNTTGQEREGPSCLGASSH